MIGKSHIKISHLMLLHLNPSISFILKRFIKTYESGVEVPDKYLMWERDPAEPAEKGNQPKHLVHRYYIDADDTFQRKGRLIEQIWMYTDGIISFVQDGIKISEAYPTTENLIENWALHFGILTHFLGDLFTPLHIGIGNDKILKKLAGLKYHSKIEQAFWRYHKTYELPEKFAAMKCHLDSEQLLKIAKGTYNEYLLLGKLYPLRPETKAELKAMSIRLLEQSVAFSSGWINEMVATYNLEPALKKAETVLTDEK